MASNDPYDRDYPGPMPLRFQMMQQEMNQPWSQTSPAQVPLWQQMAVFGAGAMGYQNAQAIPYAAPGRGIYDTDYQARVTTPLFNTMQQRLNRRMGQLFATGTAQMIENLGGFSGRPGAGYDKFMRAGESTPGQFLAQMVQQTPAMQSIMGGNIANTWTDIFANRNFLSFGPGQMVNPNSKVQMRMGAEYATMIADGITQSVMSKAGGSGRMSVTSNAAIMGGRDVGEMGSLFNIMSMQDPSFRGMSSDTYKTLAQAMSQNRSLDDKEFGRISREVSGKVARLTDTMKGLVAIGDALGQSNTMETLQTLNRVTQGNFFKLDPRIWQRFGEQMSAASKTYGISGQQQLSMLSSIGSVYAAGSGAVNPVTGRADVASQIFGNAVLTRQAMAMASASGMNPEDATAYMNHMVQQATQSTAGRLSQVIEAGYRTGRVDPAMYQQFHEAALSGDVRTQQTLVRNIGTQMGRNLFEDIRNPAYMRMSQQLIDRLPVEQQKAAQEALAARIGGGPAQEIRLRASEESLQQAARLRSSAMKMAGVSDFTSDERDRLTYGAYRSYLQGQGAGGTNKLMAIDAAYKRGGLTAVDEMVRTLPDFNADQGGMQMAGKVAFSQAQQSRALTAVATAGVGGTWLERAASSMDPYAYLQARNALEANPSNAGAILGGVYGKLDKGMQAMLGDPQRMLEDAKQVTSRGTLDRINTEYLKAAAENPNVRWGDVANKVIPGLAPAVINQMSMLNQAGLQDEATRFQLMITDPKNKAAIDTRIAAGAAPSDAIKAVIGSTNFPVGTTGFMAATLGAVGAGYSPEGMFSMADAFTASQLGLSTGIQADIERKAADAKAFMRKDAGARVVDYLTREPGSNMTIWDVLGIKVEDRKDNIATEYAAAVKQGASPEALNKIVEKGYGKGIAGGHATVMATEKAAKGKSVTEVAAMVSREFQGMGAETITEEAKLKAAQAAQFENAMTLARAGDMTELNKMAENMAVATADSDMSLRGKTSIWDKGGKERWTRTQQLQRGFMSALTDYAAGGAPVDIKNIEQVQMRIAKDARIDAMQGDKAASTSGARRMRIVLESANITVNMGDQQVPGQMTGEGYYVGG